MVEEGGADGEVVETDVALISVPAGAVGRSASSSRVLTPNLSAAIHKATSSMKTQKSNNTSNKLKEHKSITGVIVQLIDGMKEGSHNDMSARMNMLLMRQMDAMDRQMVKHDHLDCKEKHQKCKHECKCHEKHQAKKKAKRAKKAALEAPPDNGGKSLANNKSSNSNSISNYSSGSSSSISTAASATMERYHEGKSFPKTAA